LIFKLAQFKVFYDRKRSFRNWSKQNVKHYFVFILMLGLVSTLAIPTGIVMGQSVFQVYPSHQMNGARLEPTSWREHIGLCIINPAACIAFVMPTVPLYRYYDHSNGDHFYTTNKAEGDNAVASGAYVAQGIAAILYPDQQGGTLPLYRYYNHFIGDHFYTTNKAEGDKAVASGAYVAQEITGYIYSYRQPGTLPLYRYYDHSNGDHFYTTNKAEGDNAVASGNGYVAEGIAGYVLPFPCLVCHIPR
jgi:hypothetical protein